MFFNMPMIIHFIKLLVIVIPPQPPLFLTLSPGRKQINYDLNADRPVLMNVSFNYKTVFEENVMILNSNPLTIWSFWASQLIGDHLWVNMLSVISSCNSRLYLLRQLKVIGMNSEGLKQFYVANIRSILSYASPAWFCMLSQTDKDQLEHIQTIFLNNEFRRSPF